MRNSMLPLLCVWVCLGQQPDPGQRLLNGVISGILQGDDGSAIAGGYVNLQLVSPAGRLRQTDWSVVTGSGGTFRFDRLMDGSYRLCAHTPKTEWLNPCEWGLQPPRASLSFSRPAASITMILRKGASVPIRVDDPGRLLSQNEGKVHGAHLLLGVSNDAFTFRPAPIISQDAAGRNQQVLVPFDSPMKLVVFSSFFQIADAAGSPLPRSSATHIPVTVQRGQQPPAIRLTVVGGNRP